MDDYIAYVDSDAHADYKTATDPFIAGMLYNPVPFN